MYSQHLNNLIISLDSFGISSKTDKLILKAVEEEKIDRVSVLMSREISPNFVKKLLKSGVKLDIQLYLPNKSHAALFLVDIISGRFGTSKVKIIWKKQIEHFFKVFGRYPDGINSKESIHFFPTLFPAAIALWDKFSIQYLRLGKRKIAGVLKKNSFILDKFRAIDIKLNKIIFAPDGFYHNLPFELNTSDYFAKFSWIKNKDEFFENILEKGQIELVFDAINKKELEFLLDNF